LPWRRPGDGGARWDQGDRIRGLETALGGGRPRVEGKRGKAVGVHEEDELRGLGVAVRVHPPYGARLIAEADLDRAAGLSAVGPQLVGIDVELAVAEPVDPPHLAVDGPA